MTIQKYLTNGKLTDTLLRTVLRLLKLDIHFIYRILILFLKRNTADLKKLISLVSPMMFKAKNLVLLNPTFGEGSYKIEGADADINEFKSTHI